MAGPVENHDVSVEEGLELDESEPGTTVSAAQDKSPLGAPAAPMSPPPDHSVAAAQSRQCFVAGVSFHQLQLCNGILMASSLLLCVFQCTASGLLLSQLGRKPLWAGRRLHILAVWFPELLGGLASLAVSLYLRPLLTHIRALALRASSALSSSRAYTPWAGGAREAVSPALLLWMAVVPSLFSLGMLVISGLAFAVSIRVVQELEALHETDQDHAVAVVILCLCGLMVVCRLAALVSGALLPLLVGVIARCVRLQWLVYPFALFVEEDEDGNKGKPLLIQ